MTAPVSRSTAKSARNGDIAVFAANGFALASLLSRVPDTKDLLNLTTGQLGILLLSVSAGALLGLPAAGRIAHTRGAKRTVRIGLGLLAPGLVAAGLGIAFQAGMAPVMAGLFLVGLGSGIWDVAQNLEGAAIERAIGREIMPWFHAAFSGGTVLAALVGALLTWLAVPVLWHLLFVTALAAGFVWWGTGRFLPTLGDDHDPEIVAAAPAGSAWRERRTLLIGLMVLAAAFTEGTANDWIAVAFVDGHSVDNAVGVLAMALFLAAMTAGRLLGPRWLERRGRVSVLRLLFTAATLGSAMVVFGNSIVAFFGTMVWGLGASLGFPVGMSAAADDPRRAAQRISVVSTIGYTAFLGGPPLLGALGDRFGILRALLVVGAMSLIAILITPVAKPIGNSN